VSADRTLQAAPYPPAFRKTDDANCGADDAIRATLSILHDHRSVAWTITVPSVAASDGGTESGSVRLIAQREGLAWDC
jgi:hypothetical protein